MSASVPRGSGISSIDPQRSNDCVSPGDSPTLDTERFDPECERRDSVNDSAPMWSGMPPWLIRLLFVLALVLGFIVLHRLPDFY